MLQLIVAVHTQGFMLMGICCMKRRKSSRLSPSKLRCLDCKLAGDQSCVCGAPRPSAPHFPSFIWKPACQGVQFNDWLVV